MNSQWAVFLTQARRILVSRLFCYLPELRYLLVLVISKIAAEFGILEKAVRTGTPLLFLIVQNASYQYPIPENSTSPTCCWSFCRCHLHNLHTGSLPLSCIHYLVRTLELPPCSDLSFPILMPSLYTLHQPERTRLLGQQVVFWHQGYFQHLFYLLFQG